MSSSLLLYPVIISLSVITLLPMSWNFSLFLIKCLQVLTLPLINGLCCILNELPWTFSERNIYESRCREKWQNWLSYYDRFSISKEIEKVKWVFYMEWTLKIYGVIVDDLFLVLTRFHLHENMSREILIEVMYLRQKYRTSFAYRCRCIIMDLTRVLFLNIFFTLFLLELGGSC